MYGERTLSSSHVMLLPLDIQQYAVSVYGTMLQTRPRAPLMSDIPINIHVSILPNVN